MMKIADCPDFTWRLCHDISVENFQDLDSDSCDDKTPVKDLNYVLQNHNSSIKVECARKDTNNKYSDLNDSKLGHSKVKEKNEINQKQHGNYFVDDSQRQSSYQWNSDKKQNSDTIVIDSIENGKENNEKAVIISEHENATKRHRKLPVAPTNPGASTSASGVDSKPARQPKSLLDELLEVELKNQEEDVQENPDAWKASFKHLVGNPFNYISATGKQFTSEYLKEDSELDYHGQWNSANEEEKSSTKESQIRDEPTQSHQYNQFDESIGADRHGHRDNSSVLQRQVSEDTLRTEVNHIHKADTVSEVSHNDDWLKNGPFNSYQALDVTHRGMHRFIPRHDDEMLIEIGDPIHVFYEADDLWCEGVNLRSFIKGLFPSMYATDLNFLEDDSDEDGCSKFNLRFLGSIEVGYHKGNDVLCQAIKKVASRQRTSTKALPPICTVEISEYGIRMMDKSKHGQKDDSAPSHFFALKNISFCGFHPQNQRYFAFITKHPCEYRFACHVFLGNRQTRCVSEAIGRAFKRFYQEYMAFTHPTEDIYLE